MVGLIMNELMSGDLYINTFSNSVILLAQRLYGHKQIFGDWLEENMEPRHNLDGIFFSKICKLRILLNWTLLDSVRSVRIFCFRKKGLNLFERFLQRFCL
jgi:hypothetical protein